MGYFELDLINELVGVPSGETIYVDDIKLYELYNLNLIRLDKRGIWVFDDDNIKFVKNIKF